METDGPISRVSTHRPMQTKAGVMQKHDWVGIRQGLESYPGLWLEAAGEFSKGMYSYLRRGEVAAFQDMGGNIEARLLNQRLRGDGSKTMVGDLWLRWTPDGWTEQDQEKAEAAAAASEEEDPNGGTARHSQ